LKGVILHGGLGTRLRPLTFSGPKQLIPVANKPISQYALEDLVSYGIKDVAIVLGDIFPDLVKQHYGDGSRFGIKITYVEQGKPLGIAHAISLCKEFVGKDKFLVYLGDNMIQGGINKYAEKFEKNDYDAMILLKEVEDPRNFGVAHLDSYGNLIKLIEKPKEPPSNLAITGIYFLSPIIFEAIEKLKPSWRGELEITDALQMLIDWKKKVGYEILKGWWVDTGKKDDILYVNALILDERATREIKGYCFNSKVEGRVEIGEGTRLVDSTVRGPCVIGKNCKIEGSHIGPYTSIGDNCSIKDSNIEYSVIMEGSKIEGIDRLEESLIGKFAKLKKLEGNRRALKLHIGDYSEIAL